MALPVKISFKCNLCGHIVTNTALTGSARLITYYNNGPVDKGVNWC